MATIDTRNAQCIKSSLGKCSEFLISNFQAVDIR
jgi:hypothetical protein